MSVAPQRTRIVALVCFERAALNIAQPQIRSGQLSLQRRIACCFP